MLSHTKYTIRGSELFPFFFFFFFFKAFFNIWGLGGLEKDVKGFVEVMRNGKGEGNGLGKGGGGGGPKEAI